MTLRDVIQFWRDASLATATKLPDDTPCIRFCGECVMIDNATPEIEERNRRLPDYNASDSDFDRLPDEILDLPVGWSVRTQP